MGAQRESNDEPQLSARLESGLANDAGRARNRFIQILGPRQRDALRDTTALPSPRRAQGQADRLDARPDLRFTFRVGRRVRTRRCQRLRRVRRRGLPGTQRQRRRGQRSGRRLKRARRQYGHSAGSRRRARRQRQRWQRRRGRCGRQRCRRCHRPGSFVHQRRRKHKLRRSRGQRGRRRHQLRRRRRRWGHRAVLQRDRGDDRCQCRHVGRRRRCRGHHVQWCRRQCGRRWRWRRRDDIDHHWRESHVARAAPGRRRRRGRAGRLWRGWRWRRRWAGGVWHWLLHPQPWRDKRRCRRCGRHRRQWQRNRR